MNTSTNYLNLFPDNEWINFSSDMSDNDLNFHLESLLQNISEAMNVSEETITAYLNNQRTYLPSQRDALPLLATITIFYGFIFVAGILGNLITCIVISRNKSMHTATNYYLFNLAISDLILLLSGLPPDLYSMWYPMSYPFSDSICILESTLLETATNATVLTITAFSVERYIAICHPFRQHTMSKLSRAIKFILAIWVTAFILALPQAMQFSVISMNKEKICSVKNGFLAHVFAVSGCLFFVGPMTAICVLYVLIGIKLKKSKLLQGVKRYDLNRGISAQTRVIRMLIAVAVAFFLCWAPFHIQRLMAAYGLTLNDRSRLFQIVYDIMNYASGLMYFLSTCINPLLYNIMSHKFRNAFKLTLARQFGLASRYQVQNNNYYSALTRQNGSMRLNMTLLDNRSTHRTIGPLHKRESDSSLLADHSLVTRLSGGNRTPNRFRCVSVTSQATLLTSLSKNDVYANNHNRNVDYSPAVGNRANHGGRTSPTHEDIQITTFANEAVGCECGEHQKPRNINSNQYHQTKSIPNSSLYPAVATSSDLSTSQNATNSNREDDDAVIDDCRAGCTKSLKMHSDLKIERELNRSKQQRIITNKKTHADKVIDSSYNDYNITDDLENNECSINNDCIASGSSCSSNSKTLCGNSADIIVGYCDSNCEENEFSLFNLKDENNTRNYGAERKILNDYRINYIPGTARQIIVQGDGGIITTETSGTLNNYNQQDNDIPTTPIMMERQRNNSKDNMFNFSNSKNVLRKPISATVGNLTEIFGWKNNKKRKTTKLLGSNSYSNNDSTGNNKTIVLKENKTIN